jgi:purine-nucleoside phosphorylase
MEAYALNAIAKALNKKGLTILTVSDNIATGKKMPSIERQESFKDMAKLALTTAIKFA